MKLSEYQLLVEEHYGKVTLPGTSGETEEIIDMLWESMEQVSIGDYRLFQAMLIVLNWRNDHERIGNSTIVIPERD